MAMRWDESHESPDVVDRRGEGPSRPGGPNIGGLLYLLPYLLRSPFGWVILLVGGALYVGRALLFAPASTDAQRAPGGHGAAADTPEKHFVAFVLDDVQGTWSAAFAREGRTYRHAKLVLFDGATRTGCGFGDAATGPFYCPADEQVYIDLSFFRQLSGKLGAPGQFAQAYVVAHEIGHHVQKLLGISQRVEGTAHATGATGASVRLELQADCFAGIWAHSTAQRDLLEKGDIESALNAAEAIGDDRLQSRATGTVSPEKWTHGSSAERARWFRRGYEAGNVAACDTFAAKTL